MLINVEISVLSEEGYQMEKRGLEVDDEYYVFRPGRINVQHISYLCEHSCCADQVAIGLLSGTELHVRGTVEEIERKVNAAREKLQRETLLVRQQ